MIGAFSLLSYQVLFVHHYIAVTRYGDGAVQVQVLPNSESCVNLMGHGDTLCFLADKGGRL